MPMFPGSGFTIRLLRRPLDVWHHCSWSPLSMLQNVSLFGIQDAYISCTSSTHDRWDYASFSCCRNLVRLRDTCSVHEKRNFGIALLSCIEAEIYVMSYLLSVNGCHLQHIQTLDSIPTCLIVLPDPENMGIVVGISLLYREQNLRWTLCHIHFLLMAFVYHFQRIQISESNLNSLFVLADHKNVGTAVGISWLSSIQSNN